MYNSKPYRILDDCKTWSSGNRVDPGTGPEKQYGSSTGSSANNIGYEVKEVELIIIGSGTGSRFGPDHP